MALSGGYFLPGLRHLAGIAAGASRMPYWTFALYAYAGAFLWTLTFLAIGWLVGEECLRQCKAAISPSPNAARGLPREATGRPQTTTQGSQCRREECMDAELLRSSLPTAMDGDRRKNRIRKVSSRWMTKASAREFHQKQNASLTGKPPASGANSVASALGSLARRDPGGLCQHTTRVANRPSKPERLLW